MEQIIKINCPEGKKAVYNEVTQTIDFVDIVRSKSWEEFCKNHILLKDEYYIYDGAVKNIRGLNRLCNKQYLASKEDAEGILALIQLTRLHDEWIGDWKPTYIKADRPNNWLILHSHEDDNTDRFVVEWTDHVNSLLTFPTKEMAQEFLDCFRDLIENAKKFI